MKQSFALLIALGLLITPAFAQKNNDLTASFDKLLRENYTAGGSGCAVLVAQKGKIIYQDAAGMANMEINIPVRADNVFRIGSISKQFTAVAILLLAEQGKLSLQDEITKFIPDYPTQGKKITIEHLLTHTSGIQSYTDMPEWTEEVHRNDFTPAGLVDFFKNKPMNFDPGTQWRYNNSGYILLGYIIEKVSGQSYEAYLQEHIFTPVGMTHTYYDMPEKVIPKRASGYQKPGDDYQNASYLSMTQPYAAGSLASTVQDLYIWTSAVQSGKVLKKQSMQKAFSPYILSDGSNSHYGYGWFLGNLLGSATIEHDGGINGFLSSMVYLPKEDICVVALSNCDCKPPSDMVARFAALTAGKALDPTAVKLSDAEMESVTGVFEGPAEQTRIITFENGQLYSQRSGSSKLKIFPSSKDDFFFESSLTRFHFDRDASGKVISLSAADRQSDKNTWPKTDKKPAIRTEITLPETDLDKFLGEYELFPSFTLTITRKGAQLIAQATGQPSFEIYASSPIRFFLKVVEAEIEFVPDADGKVSRLILHQGGQDMPGTRIK